MHVHVLSKVIEIHEEEQYVMHETCCELSEVAVNANSNAPLQHFGGRLLQCITTYSKDYSAAVHAWNYSAL